MEELWKTILVDEQLLKLFDDINLHIHYVIDHGKLHTLNVLKYKEKDFNPTPQLSESKGEVYEKSFKN